MLTILGGLAEFERTLSKPRTGAGERALKLFPHQRRARRSSGWTPVPLLWVLPGRLGWTGRPVSNAGGGGPVGKKNLALMVEAPSSAHLSLALPHQWGRE